MSRSGAGDALIGADRSADRREVLAVVVAEAHASTLSDAADQRKARPLSSRARQPVGDAWIDVERAHAEHAAVGEAARDERVDHAEWLNALRLAAVDQPGSRSKVETGPDDQHGADAPLRFQCPQRAEPQID